MGTSVFSSSERNSVVRPREGDAFVGFLVGEVNSVVASSKGDSVVVLDGDSLVASPDSDSVFAS